MPDQLREIPSSRSADLSCRWFNSDKLDLFVWSLSEVVKLSSEVDADGADLIAFELSWRHFENEIGIRWSEQDGYAIYELQANSRHQRHAGSSIAKGPSDRNTVSAQTLLRIRSAFRAASEPLPPTLKRLVDNRLNELLLHTL